MYYANRKLIILNVSSVILAALVMFLLLKPRDVGIDEERMANINGTIQTENTTMKDNMPTESMENEQCGNQMSTTEVMEPEDDVTMDTIPEAVTEPTEPEIAENKGQNDGTDASEGDPLNAIDFAQYMSLSPQDQERFYNSFESPENFFAWYNAARSEYEAGLGAVEINGDSSVDLGDLIG